MCFLVTFLIQIGVVNIMGEENKQKSPIMATLQIITAVKAILCSFTVLAQVLEWTCLNLLMSYQAQESQKNRLLVSRDEY